MRRDLNRSAGDSAQHRSGGRPIRLRRPERLPMTDAERQAAVTAVTRLIAWRYRLDAEGRVEGWSIVPADGPAGEDQGAQLDPSATG
jgi:hypothetical protein